MAHEVVKGSGEPDAVKDKKKNTLLADYGPLAVGFTSLLALWTIGHNWLDRPSLAALVIIFTWLSAAILYGAIGVRRHAEELAKVLGEPLGTLILTLSAISIEVALIASVMLTGDQNPTLARDTMFSVLMIIMNGLVGLALLAGGLRHRQQAYNLEGARAFLVTLLPLGMLALLLPTFTTTTADPTLAKGQAVAFSTLTLVLYVAFLTIQTLRHSNFFQDPDAATEVSSTHGHHRPPRHRGRFLLQHAALLFATLLPVALIAHALASVVEFGIREVGVPDVFAGVLIATLILAPEGLTGFYAAWDNHMQRSVNILLGSALSTIGLTVPVVLLIGLITGHDVVLGLNPAEGLLLGITMIVSTLTFSGTRTDTLKGAVHLTLFVVFLLLVIEP